MEVLQEEKKDEKTLNMQARRIFWYFKNMAPALLDQKISRLYFELSFLFKLLYDSSILYF